MRTTPWFITWLAAQAAQGGAADVGSAIPLEPSFVAAYDPNANCNCDPSVHFSHFTRCELTVGPNAHITVTHSHHKKCHPLASDYFSCTAVRWPRVNFLANFLPFTAE